MALLHWLLYQTKQTSVQFSNQKSDWQRVESGSCDIARLIGNQYISLLDEAIRITLKVAAVVEVLCFLLSSPWTHF